MLFNEGAAWRNFLSHQHGKHMVGSNDIGKRHAESTFALSGSIVVSQSWSAFISPKTLITLDLDPFSSIFAEESTTSRKCSKVCFCSSSSNTSKSSPSAIEYLIKVESISCRVFPSIDFNDSFFVKLDEMEACRMEHLAFLASSRLQESMPMFSFMALLLLLLRHCFLRCFKLFVRIGKAWAIDHVDLEARIESLGIFRMP